MELKHKECFIPNIIRFYNLQSVSKYAREVAEFVNLYSKMRGINRFPGLVETLERVKKRPEVAARGISITIPQSLKQWIKKETRLGNAALEEKLKSCDDADLQRALDWSRAVNQTIAEMVHDVPPFPSVRNTFENLKGKADMVVCSATPNATLQSEWNEHKIDSYVTAICGQESGNKIETLANAAKYPLNHSLMIGDSPGDYRAALVNNVLFYPINPNGEEASWRRLADEAIDRFLNGEYAGEYQRTLLNEFDRRLPEKPPWE